MLNSASAWKFGPFAWIASTAARARGFVLSPIAVTTT